MSISLSADFIEMKKNVNMNLNERSKILDFEIFLIFIQQAVVQNFLMF